MVARLLVVLSVDLWGLVEAESLQEMQMVSPSRIDKAQNLFID